jgi:hypothetical protein
MVEWNNDGAHSNNYDTTFTQPRDHVVPLFQHFLQRNFKGVPSIVPVQGASSSSSAPIPAVLIEFKAGFFDSHFYIPKAKNGVKLTPKPKGGKSKGKGKGKDGGKDGSKDDESSGAILITDPSKQNYNNSNPKRSRSADDEAGLGFGRDKKRLLSTTGHEERLGRASTPNMSYLNNGDNNWSGNGWFNTGSNR